MLRAIVAFIAGFVAVYAIAMILAVFGYSTVAGLPYEQLLAVMAGGGALCAVAALRLGRHRGKAA